jgi:hypothetical protein
MTKLPSVAYVYELPLALRQVVTLRSTVHAIDGVPLGPSDLFDFGAGGLRLVDDDLAATVRVEATGAEGSACVAARVATPCLAPKIDALAHAKLLTPSELAGTLSGGVEVDATALPHPVEAVDAAEVGSTPLPLPIAAAAGVAIALAVVVVGRAILRRRPLAAVLRAARAARNATRRDATLADVRRRVDDLVLHARVVDRVRRDCEERRARIDRDALAAGLPAEREEAARLEQDLARSKEDLARVASALRLVAMQAREGRVRDFTPDPVEELTAELALRDEALAEMRAPPPPAA